MCPLCVLCVCVHTRYVLVCKITQHSRTERCNIGFLCSECATLVLFLPVRYFKPTHTRCHSVQPQGKRNSNIIAKMSCGCVYPKEHICVSDFPFKGVLFSKNCTFLLVLRSCALNQGCRVGVHMHTST